MLCMEKKIPIYGDGKQKRDWIYVGDCTSAIIKILKIGIVGQDYNIGSRNTIMNLELVKKYVK